MNSHTLEISSYNILSWSNYYPDNNVNLFNLFIDPSYQKFYKSKKFKKNIEKINKYLSFCLKKTNGQIEIFPYPNLLFASLNSVPLNKIKIVILGQDPYHGLHNNIPLASGLSFSVPKGIPIPSSLQNIYKNLVKFNHIDKIPKHGNLSSYAYQGILFLNTILTVQKGCPNGHKDKWEDLTDHLISFISNNTDHIIFMLWGKNAYEKIDLIDQTKHLVTVSSHPSGLSCNTKFKNYNSFLLEDHFGKANAYLKKFNKDPIFYKII